MNKIHLDHIQVPNDLSASVDNSILKAKARERVINSVRRYTSAAAVIALCVIAFNFNTAATFADAAKQFFLAFYNNTFNNSSRIDAINNDFYSDDVSMGVSESEDLIIELVNYYIDVNEAGFEYVITGRNLDEYSDMVVPLNRRIAITVNTSGESQVWEEAFDPETQMSSRTFPGGKFLNDPQNDIYEYIKGGNDILGDTRLAKIGENTYSLVDTVRFSKPIIIGDEISLQYNSLAFSKYGPNPLDNPVREYIEGVWDFKIVVDDKFKNIDVLTYEIINGETASQKGISLEEISVTPLVTKLTFAIDYSKNGIANPDNIYIVSEPQYVYKLNLMDLCAATVIKTDDKIYENKAGSFIEQENGLDRCILEYDSLYFHNTEYFSVNITERSGEVITIEVLKIMK